MSDAKNRSGAKKSSGTLKHRELYRLFFEEAPDGMLAADPHGRFIIVNRRLSALTGYSREELLRMTIVGILGLGDGARGPIGMDALLAGGVVTKECAILRKDGGSLPVEISARLQPEGNVLVVVRDLTEQKRIEQAMRESELKHRTLFETAGDAIMLVRRDRFIDCNARTLTMFGCSREQIIGAPPYELSPPTQPDGRCSREKALEKINLAVTEGPQFFEWEHRRLDGTPFRAEVSLNRLELSGETLLQAIVRDVTERKKSLEALRQSESTLRSVFRAAPVGIFILKDRICQSANRYWCVKFGYPEAGIVGKSTRMLYESNEEYDRVGRALYTHLQERGMASTETRMRCSDGSFRQVILTTAPIRHDDPSAGTVGIIFDITEHRQAEEEIRLLHRELQHHAAELERRVAERTAELAVARDHAEEADRLKSAFLATMSHELRTPLNSIIGFTGILLMGLVGPLTPEQKKQLTLVQDSAHHLLDLINDVLDISKIEAGQIELAHDPFDMRTAVLKSIEKIASLADKKGLALASAIAPTVGQIVGDRRRVEQVLINLLANAVKFTDRGGVRIETDVEDGWLVTRVIDSGIGIRPEDMDTLFKPFRQLDAGTARQYEGTGLGLSICKRLAESMGGSIRVESERGEGSCFIFSLPIERALT